VNDPVLNQQLEDLEALIRQWDGLTQILSRARREGRAAEETEKAFQEARAECARQAAALLDRLEIAPDSGGEILEALKIGSLGSIVSLPEMQWRKIDETRGRAEVGLQGLHGILQARRQCIGSMNPAILLARKVFLSWPMKLLYLTAGIVIIFLVLSAALR